MTNTIYKAMTINTKFERLFNYEIYKLSDSLVLSRNSEEQKIITELHQELTELYDMLDEQEQELKGV